VEVIIFMSGDEKHPGVCDECGDYSYELLCPVCAHKKYGGVQKTSLLQRIFHK
jgi:hypothetical protein